MRPVSFAWNIIHLVVATPIAGALIYFTAVTRKDFSCRSDGTCPVGVFSNSVYHTLTLALALECVRLAFLLITSIFAFMCLRGPVLRIMFSYAKHITTVLGALVCGAHFSNQIILNSAGTKDRDSTVLFALTIVELFVDVLFL